MEKLVTIGSVAVIAGILLIIIGSLAQQGKGSKKTEIKSAGIVFIGPIPFGWASDKQTFYALLMISIAVFLFLIVFLRKIR